jgi:hypothetical protein
LVDVLEQRQADIERLIRGGIGTMRLRAIAILVVISVCAVAGRVYASPCHQFTIARSVPLGFGTPFDVLSESNAPLVTGDCADAGIAVSVGASGQAVYRYGDWLLGPGSVTLPRPAASDATVSFIAFTCTQVGGFIQWKCGCRHYYCDVPMWQLQSFRYGAAPPQPEVLTPRDNQIFSRAGEIRPDGSIILLDGHVVHTTNFWTRMLPERFPSDLTSPINYAAGRMDVRLEVLSMASPLPFFYEICLENGTHGMDGWGENLHEAEIRLDHRSGHLYVERRPASRSLVAERAEVRLAGRQAQEDHDQSPEAGQPDRAVEREDPELGRLLRACAGRAGCRAW